MSQSPVSSFISCSTNGFRTARLENFKVSEFQSRSLQRCNLETLKPRTQDFMSVLKLKIDVSGTIGDEAWKQIQQFDQIQSADFGPQFGSGGRCNHAPDAPHGKGEWIGAEIRLQTPLLAQYAVTHYLEQERVLDADVVE